MGEWEPTLKETTLKSSATPVSTAATSPAPAAARMSLPTALITSRPLVDMPAIAPPSPAASPSPPSVLLRARAGCRQLCHPWPQSIGRHRRRRRPWTAQAAPGRTPLSPPRPPTAEEPPRPPRWRSAQRTKLLKEGMNNRQHKKEYAFECDPAQPAHHRHHVHDHPPSHQRTGKGPRATWT